MTSLQRMIARRHHQAYLELGPADEARRAAIRIALAIGMTQGDTAKLFGVARKTVCSIHTGRRGSVSANLAALRVARDAIARAEHGLITWRGRERAAMARLERGNIPIPENLGTGSWREKV